MERPPVEVRGRNPVIAQGIALAAACDYLDDIGMENVQRTRNNSHSTHWNNSVKRVTWKRTVRLGNKCGGLVAFNLDSVHAHDLSSFLDDVAVAVRAGDHCTQPLHDKMGVPASARASFYIYNTRRMDKLVSASTTPGSCASSFV